MTSCSTLYCHLHGAAFLTCLVCISTDLARSIEHRQDILPSKGAVYTSVFAYVGTSFVANAYTVLRVSLFAYTVLLICLY